AVDPDIEDVDDVAMLDGGRDARLAQEALVAFAARLEQHLHGDLALQAFVLGAINPRHAALADALLQQVAADARAFTRLAHVLDAARRLSGRLVASDVGSARRGVGERRECGRAGLDRGVDAGLTGLG